jgi:hypothetical protein
MLNFPLDLRSEGVALMSIRAIPVLTPLVFTAALAACGEAQPPQIPPRQVSYADEVAPILQEHCAECHMPGLQGARESGFVVDSYDSVMKGTAFGPVVNPGSAITSSLYILLTGKDRLTVTMPHGKDSLGDEDIETIRVWIDSGAVEN